MKKPSATKPAAKTTQVVPAGNQQQSIISKEIESLFPSVIGQDAHKLFLGNSILANRKSNSPIQPIFVSGERGAGKTTLLRDAIRALNAEVILPLCDPNLSTLPRPNDIRGDNGDQGPFRQFQDNLLVMLSSHKRGVIVQDELQDMGRGPNYSPSTFKHLANLFMTVAILSKEGRVGSVQIGENWVEWNPSRHFLLTASNYPEKINGALLSRFREITLGAFTPEELAKILIVKLTNKGLRAAADSVKRMVNVCRTSAREVDTLVGEVIAVVGAAGKSTVSKEDVKVAMLQLQRFPFGFCADFCQLLEMLDGVTYTTPQLASIRPGIAGILGNELALAARVNLLARVPKGWTLTKGGRDALTAWKKEGFAW